jgi:hypothetical protein
MAPPFNEFDSDRAPCALDCSFGVAGLDPIVPIATATPTARAVSVTTTVSRTRRVREILRLTG